jgi:hypothetical protein
VKEASTSGAVTWKCGGACSRHANLHAQTADHASASPTMPVPSPPNAVTRCPRGIEGATAAVAGRLQDNLERRQIHRHSEDRESRQFVRLCLSAQISLCDFGIHASEFGHSCWVSTG